MGFDNLAVDWWFCTNLINMQHRKTAMGDCSLVLGGVSWTQTTFPITSDWPSKAVSSRWFSIVVTWGYALFNLEERCCNLETRYCSCFLCTWALSNNINKTSWHLGSTLQSGFQNLGFDNFAVILQVCTICIKVQHWKRAMGDCSLVLGGVSGTQTTSPTMSDRRSDMVWQGWGTRFQVSCWGLLAPLPKLEMRSETTKYRYGGIFW